MKKLALALAAILLLSTCSAFADVILEGEKVWDGDTPFEFTLMIDDSYEPDGRVVYEMLEKKTNVHVKLNLAPYQVQLEKMAVALSTGDYADVIAGWLLGTKLPFASLSRKAMRTSFSSSGGVGISRPRRSSHT